MKAEGRLPEDSLYSKYLKGEYDVNGSNDSDSSDDDRPSKSSSGGSPIDPYIKAIKSEFKFQDNSAPQKKQFNNWNEVKQMGLPNRSGSVGYVLLFFDQRDKCYGFSFTVQPSSGIYTDPGFRVFYFENRGGNYRVKDINVPSSQRLWITGGQLVIGAKKESLGSGDNYAIKISDGKWTAGKGFIESRPEKLKSTYYKKKIWV